MKLIIPMAGMGKRMRPHTLTVPKPLLPIAGKPIVQRLAEEITQVSAERLNEIAFIIGDFGKEVEDKLLKIAKSLGAKGKIYYQKKALGTAHAVYCAAESLDDNVIVAFADTLFKADFHLNKSAEAIIWTKEVENPEAFGVIKTDKEGIITEFAEKPKKFVSNKAIIGIYYFREGETLAAELKKLIDNKQMVNGEYQLTDVLETMKSGKTQFRTETVSEWLDCGNKNATVHTNSRILHHIGNQISEDAEIKNSLINEPCYVAPGVKIRNSVIGPYVSLEKNSEISSSIISDSIVQSETQLENVNLKNSLIGNFVKIIDKAEDFSIGDYSQLNL